MRSVEVDEIVEKEVRKRRSVNYTRFDKNILHKNTYTLFAENTYNHKNTKRIPTHYLPKKHVQFQMEK